MAKPRVPIPEVHNQWLLEYLKHKGWLEEGTDAKDYIHKLEPKQWYSVKNTLKKRVLKIDTKAKLEELKELRGAVKATYTPKGL